MTQLSTSKTDMLACALRQIADSIAKIDDNFADENGDVKIDSLDDGIKIATMAYSLIQEIYKCYGKEFSVAIPGAGGKLIELILELLSTIGEKRANETPTETPA